MVNALWGGEQQPAELVGLLPFYKPTKLWCLLSLVSQSAVRA